MVNDKMKSHELPMAGIISVSGNSEKFSTGSWRSKRPIHIEEKCKHCMLCILPCPDCATLHGDGKKMIGFDLDKCKGCGICAKVCPFGAIEMIDDDGGVTHE